MGSDPFPGVKSGRGVKVTPHPLLVPLVMKERSYTSTTFSYGPYGLYRALGLYKGALYHSPSQIYYNSSTATLPNFDTTWFEAPKPSKRQPQTNEALPEPAE